MLISFSHKLTKQSPTARERHDKNNWLISTFSPAFILDEVWLEIWMNKLIVEHNVLLSRGHQTISWIFHCSSQHCLLHACFKLSFLSLTKSKTLWTRLPVLLPEMVRSLSTVSGRMKWTTPSSISWTLQMLTMHTTSTRSKSSRRAKVSRMCRISN